VKAEGQIVLEEMNSGFFRNEKIVELYTIYENIKYEFRFF